MAPQGVLLIAAMLALARPDLPAGPKPGDAYPTYLLPSLTESPLSIAHFRGKKVLLLQFASW